MSASKPTPAEIKEAMRETAILWKPQLLPEGSTAAQLEQHRGVLRQALADADRIKTNCHDCTNFAIEHCRHHNADVPVEFQKAEGQCDAWRYDGIPF
jgi:hypothetical protein